MNTVPVTEIAENSYASSAVCQSFRLSCDASLLNIAEIDACGTRRKLLPICGCGGEKQCQGNRPQERVAAPRARNCDHCKPPTG